MIHNSSHKQEYVANEGKTDYVVPKSRKANIIAYILSLIAALVLWGYVSMMEHVDVSQIVFSSQKLEIDGESELKNQYGLIVQSVSEEALSITLSGKEENVRKLSSSDIRLYVDLSEQHIDSAGTFELDVHSEVPEGFDATLSVEKIQVTIDKPDTRVFEVGSENIQLVGWIRESGCTIATSVNISKVTLEGNTANLNRVAGVEIRTVAIGTISNSEIIVSAGVYLLDEAGNVLDLPITVRTDSPQGGIAVTLNVQKEATIDLSVQQRNGFLNGDGVLTISPAKVRVVGELEQIHKLLQSDKLPLILPDADFVTDGKLDEKKLFENQVLTGLSCRLPAGVEGIQITLEDGSPFEGATLTVNVSAIRSETVELSAFTLSDPERFAIDPDIKLSVTFRSAGDDHAFEQFINSLAELSIIVNTNTYDPETSKAAVEIRIPPAYGKAAYSMGEYEVTLTVITPSTMPGTSESHEQDL